VPSSLVISLLGNFSYLVH